MIAIIGASGFIGKHLQAIIKEKYKNSISSVLMVYFNNETFIDKSFPKASFRDFINDKQYAKEIDTIISVSGNSKRNFDYNDMNNILLKDTNYLLNIQDNFNCNIILLSSAAVYDGCEGEVCEDQVLFPDSLYGISKLYSEKVANYVIHKFENKKLVIYRLMYAFGEFEKESRLISALIKSIKEKEVFNVFGYENHINPISGWFASRILMETALNIDIFAKREIINLSSSSSVTLKQGIESLNSIFKFKYEYCSKEPHLKYWNSTDKLKCYLRYLNIVEPDPIKNLQSYFQYKLNEIHT